MTKLRDNVPNFITLLNLVCGAISVIMALTGDPALAGYFIFIAAVLDFMDGFVARLLNAKSQMGAQLDSLADVISFGLAPAVIMFVLLDKFKPGPGSGEMLSIWPYVSLLLAIASAFRLARFNNEPDQAIRFSGLPTPAMGLFVAAIPLAIKQYTGNHFVISILENPYILALIILTLSWLMISRISMLSLKMKNLLWKENRFRYILAIVSTALLLAFGFAGISLSIVAYIFISFFDREEDLTRNESFG